MNVSWFGDVLAAAVGVGAAAFAIGSVLCLIRLALVRFLEGKHGRI